MLDELNHLQRGTALTTPSHVNTRSEAGRHSSLRFETPVPLTFKDRLKLFLGPIVYPDPSLRWDRYLKANPSLGQMAGRHPRLLHKIYRPYLSNQLTCGQRVDALICHYGQLMKSGFGDFMSVVANRAVLLSEFAGRSGTSYRLQLSGIDDASRDGEWCLRLVSGTTCLYSASFAIVENSCGLYIKLGCLQGTRCADGASAIKQATKDFYGCRPKNLMVATIRDMASYFHCRGLLLVSNENRISINTRRRRRITSDYDTTWSELGAWQRPDGDFELPCCSAEPIEFDSVPSKKRAEAKRKNALLESIIESVRMVLDQSRSKAIVPLRDAFVLTSKIAPGNFLASYRGSNGIFRNCDKQRNFASSANDQNGSRLLAG